MATKKPHAQRQRPNVPKRKRASPRSRLPGIPASVINDILRDIACGIATYKAVESRGYPAPTFWWMLASDEELADKYARRKAQGLDAVADQITRASDEPQIVTKTIITPKGDVINIETDVTERSKLKMDSRKWILARLAPRKYGDRVTQELVGSGGGPIKSETTIVDDIQARLDALRERMRALALPEKKSD